MGTLRKTPIGWLSVKGLIALRAEIYARPGRMVRKCGPLYHQLLLLHLHHAQERLETQGVEPFLLYVDRVRRKEKPGRADKAFVALPSVVAAVEAGATVPQSPAAPPPPQLDAPHAPRPHEAP